MSMGGTFGFGCWIGSTDSIKNYGNFTYDFVIEPMHPINYIIFETVCYILIILRDSNCVGTLRVAGFKYNSTVKKTYLYSYIWNI